MRTTLAISSLATILLALAAPGCSGDGGGGDVDSGIVRIDSGGGEEDAGSSADGGADADGGGADAGGDVDGGAPTADAAITDDAAMQGDGGPMGAACGTRGTPPCPDGFYCDFPPASMCGVFDGGGTCREMPGACIPEGPGVCGCDGTTYPNACLAASAGVSVDHAGACGTTPVDCEPRVTCRRVSPTCRRGEVPSVIEEGSGFRCWGDCVPIAECSCTDDSLCPMPYSCDELSMHCG